MGTMVGRRILLADDEPEVQRAVRRLAAQHGWEMIAVTNGSEVKAAALDARPDIVVLDIAFPDVDGRDVLLQLKADPLTAGIPVVIWSARNPESDRPVALRLGAEDYIEKSDVGNMLAKIKRLLLRLESP